MLETKSALPTSGCPAPMAQPNDGIDGVLPTLTLASGALKLIVAVITKQVGVQLIEWVIDAIVQAARHETQRRAIGRQPLLVAPSE